MGDVKWKYYNHAVVPTTAPHEKVDLESLENGNIWKIDKRAVLARWITDFDCEVETDWWFLIKDSPIILEELSSSSRKHIRQGLKKNTIREINPIEYSQELYECYKSAFERYERANNEQTKENFLKGLSKGDVSYWCGFDNETNKISGFMTVRVNVDYVEIITAKFSPELLKNNISNALYYTVINYYFDFFDIKYVSSGQRSVNHITNTQEYKEKTFGYRKAYCRLNIKYKWAFRLIVNCIYPFRKILLKLDSNRTIHQINALLSMEKIHRESTRKLKAL